MTGSPYLNRPLRSLGQAWYDSYVRRNPTYTDGTPRQDWDQLLPNTQTYYQSHAILHST